MNSNRDYFKELRDALGLDIAPHANKVAEAIKAFCDERYVAKGDCDKHDMTKADKDQENYVVPDSDTLEELKKAFMLDIISDHAEEVVGAIKAFCDERYEAKKR